MFKYKELVVLSLFKYLLLYFQSKLLACFQNKKQKEVSFQISFQNKIAL